MASGKAFEIREQLLAEIHLGHLRPGDRLPSIRAVAKRSGVDARKLARIYRELEQEKLIEVRGRSGVFLSREEEHDQIRLGELERWTAGVAIQAWTRGIAVHQLVSTIEELTRTVQLRCLVVESSSDQIDQFAEELRDDFGLAVTSFNTKTPKRPKDEMQKALRAAASRVDILATSVFDGALVSKVADAVGKPCFVITMNDLATSRMESLLSEGSFTLIAEDPRHQERIEILLPHLKGRISVVPLETATRSRGQLEAQERVFITRSAKRAWPRASWPLLFPYSVRIICPAAATELCRAIISANMSAAKKIKERVLYER
jgi:DNA-binding transcriptional regulator YhcF (GntR family)